MHRFPHSAVEILCLACVGAGFRRVDGVFCVSPHACTVRTDVGVSWWNTEAVSTGINSRGKLWLSPTRIVSDKEVVVECVQTIYAVSTRNGKVFVIATY